MREVQHDGWPSKFREAAAYLLWYSVLSTAFFSLYRPVSFLSAGGSAILLVVILLPAVLVSTFLTESREEDFFVSAAPLTLYTLLTCCDSFPWAAPAIVAALAILDLPLLWTMAHPSPRLNPDFLLEWRRRLIQRAAGRGAAVCLALLLCMMFLDLLPRSDFPDVVQSTAPQASVEALVQSSLPDLQVFCQESWDAADEDQRIAGCSAAISLAARHLGLPDVPDLNVYRMREDLAGTSDGVSIFLNWDILRQDQPDLVLDCCFHETYHIYTNALIQVYQGMQLDSQTQELYLFRRLEQYSQERDHYISSADSLTDYYSQALEEDARAYAAYMTSEVLSMLQS